MTGVEVEGSGCTSNELSATRRPIKGLYGQGESSVPNLYEKVYYLNVKEMGGVDLLKSRRKFWVVFIKRTKEFEKTSLN